MGVPLKFVVYEQKKNRELNKPSLQIHLVSFSSPRNALFSVGIDGIALAKSFKSCNLRSAYERCEIGDAIDG